MSTQTQDRAGGSLVTPSPQNAGVAPGPGRTMGSRHGSQGSALVAVLAALTTYLTLLSWSGFSETPSVYLIPLFGVCAVVAGSGILLRAARVPAPLAFVGQAALLLMWAHAAYGGDTGSFLPTVESMRNVLDTLRTAAESAQLYAAPVPSDVDELPPLLIMSGAVVALVVDLLAAGLHKVTLAGLPLLAMYTAPVSILDGGVSWVSFGLAALAFVFLLAAEQAQRLGRWGRGFAGTGPVSDTRSGEAATRTLWPAAQKIGLSATGLAVLVPLLLPSLGAGLSGGFGNGPGGGGDGLGLDNPILDLRRNLDQGEDRPVLLVSTEDPDPSYLRLSVLDEFTGDSWRPAKRDIPEIQIARGDLPAPAGLSRTVPTQLYFYGVEIYRSFPTTWLPTKYPVASLEAPGDWRYDLSTMDFLSAVEGVTAADKRYSFEHLDVRPTVTDLVNAGSAPAGVFGPNTELPDIPAIVGELAREVTQGSTSRFQSAVMLQDWFREEFEYSLDRSEGTSTEQLVRFLTEGDGGRVGYCEQFATSMAMMARFLGIPARVAVGFLRPDRLGSDTYEFSTHDLHAWPELYFQGVGWMRFEPTPQSRASSVPSYTREELTAPSLEPSESESASAVLPGREETATVLPSTVAPGAGGGAGGGVPWRWLGLVPLLAALAATPRLLRSVVRRRRWAVVPLRERAEAAWDEIRDSARDLRLGWSEHGTLRTSARDLSAHFGLLTGSDVDEAVAARTRGPASDPAATAALERIVLLLERVRYAAVPPIAGAGSPDVREDTELVVAALGRGTRRSARRRATWLPSSLWRPARRRESARRGRVAALNEPGVDQAT